MTSAETKRGYSWGVGSLLLVTLAQLLLKWGMVRIPLFSLSELQLSFIFNNLTSLAAVTIGIMCYALSMLCWFFALRILPLHRAYTLLSLSYALVYLAAVTLPWFNENVHLLKACGGILIMFGVWLIHSKPSQQPH
ncbi:MAG: 4-amino-4-deoxy-L-arabinose-phosphoundecaprenol flippase subunit ArnF [Ewingella americana]|jgi:undecaprenyl phosphate-alpha-L-ara4N flippase subunit ArnF|uniref:Probable 4-amino-4-deoxy-L-arabinose-phosphoundecaprenol flippase subunit ArnF n=2 Tax=Ewingella americana TaxID=41202 RepID=A0A085GAK3_EWIA3|nr:4-amino-4-deoxy-L-arabinose-phosphoundecaprenol flippase subunit ArnF [Ewingella americana]KAA8730130.1 4-amino-4-deoxy-L-arabinose-phosphoundecaprenol flippase subunit ArnF [Ewingella americana]KFC80748.1 polymyxin resistance protein [Ewingella americana ATCC 33852]MCI1679049.1 4-amino-4-deoxy-L-arabinose-phosphoundecaprenol flippase subunit ArnF [Ewingella americana]MCI1852307.1 4-amino-4-deoxy-L-arabinose-phosphoundecaprenol flippase subunit ArnF [Ewingella americana]MCI1862709.1 4-amino